MSMLTWAKPRRSMRKKRSLSFIPRVPRGEHSTRAWHAEHVYTLLDEDRLHSSFSSATSRERAAQSASMSLQKPMPRNTANDPADSGAYRM